MEGVIDLTAKTQDIGLMSTGLKTLAMLFIVLGLLILALFLMKRFLLQRRGAKDGMIIKVLSTMHISPKQRIEVIEVSGEKIVLGVTPGNINFLTKIDSLNLQNGRSDGEQEQRENKIQEYQK